MIASLTTANTIDHMRVVVNQIIALAEATDSNGTLSYGQANTARNLGNTIFGVLNVAFSVANGAYGMANTANSVAVGNTNTISSVYSQRVTRPRLNFIPGTNITINVDDYSADQTANITITSTAADGIVAQTAFSQANTARDQANAAFVKANTANNIAVGNTLTTFTQRAARSRLNFIHGTNININVDDDSVGDRVNVTISSTATGSDTTNIAFNTANLAFGTANLASTNGISAFAKANLVSNVANGAFVQANTATNTAISAFITANGAYGTANLAFGTANGAVLNVIAAFAKANAALANGTGTLAGALTVTGALTGVANVQGTNVRATTAFVFPNGNVITNLTISTSSPSGGANGDIWLKII